MTMSGHESGPLTTTPGTQAFVRNTVLYRLRVKLLQLQVWPGATELRHAPTFPGAVCALARRVEGTNFRRKIAKDGST